MEPGSRLGHFEIMARVGAGGMGEVFKARDTKLKRDVAIKTLPAELARDARRLARLEREATSLAAVNHPNIASIYGLEEHEGTRFLVLELVDGETLEGLIMRGPPPIAQALEMAVQIASALEVAHEHDVVHRDLKPANVMITRDGLVKVLDFGLAKRVDGAGSDASKGATLETEIGAVMGTAPYMSPEQARARPADKRSDVWAFGCVLFEMLTGRRAFAAATVADTIAAILEREPDWSAIPKGVPRSIARLLRRCLEKDPARRLRDMGHARVEIEHALAPPALVTRATAWTGAVLILAAVLVGFLWLRPAPTAPADRSRWVQLTNFDYATQPALSPDGRMIAFIRGPGTFTTEGQIYLRQLPDGEAIALTSDDRPKMSPVFSPDGSRIAYTIRDAPFNWDTWIVPVLRGQPRPWLTNASGLSWPEPGRLLFSEIKSGIHMGVATASESRSDLRDVYVPEAKGGMAHRSRRSPDGRWVVIVEMDEQGAWLPCRLVPFEGSGKTRSVGPRDARCTEAVWSPDGSSIYFSADAGDGFHVWRQRFPEGTPEQLTFGPTQEEGLAIAPDGRWLITSVGLRQRSVWIHDESGDRQVSTEGYAYWPLFSADGRQLVYRISTGSDSAEALTELWAADLESGQLAPLLPDFRVTGYQISSDGRVVASVPDASGRERLWLAWLDRRATPQRIPGAEGDMPAFGRPGEIIFRGKDGRSTALFRIREDGTGREKIAASAGTTVAPGVSPDGQWVVGNTATGGERRVVAFSTRGAPPVAIRTGEGRARWSADGRRLYVSVRTGDTEAFARGRTYVLPVPAGATLPELPPGGFRSEEELAAVPGVDMIPFGDVAPGPRPGTYAYSRVSVTRNLYRIPLR